MLDKNKSNRCQQWSRHCIPPHPPSNHRSIHLNQPSRCHHHPPPTLKPHIRSRGRPREDAAQQPDPPPCLRLHRRSHARHLQPLRDVPRRRPQLPLLRPPHAPHQAHRADCLQPPLPPAAGGGRRGGGPRRRGRPPCPRGSRRQHPRDRHAPPPAQGLVRLPKHARGHLQRIRGCAGAVVLLPYHKHRRCDGSMELPNEVYRTTNHKVLEWARFTVEPWSTGGVNARDGAQQHVALLFFGGADDREALSYAAFQNGHPAVKMTVVGFLSALEKENGVG